MGKGTYYAARAAGRAAVRERTRARQAKERAQRKNPEAVNNTNKTNQELGLGGVILAIIVTLILMLTIFS